MSATRSDPAVELVPPGRPFNVVVDAAELRRPQRTGVTIIGPGFFWSADDIDMASGARDIIRFDPAGDTVSYRNGLGRRRRARSTGGWVRVRS